MEEERFPQFMTGVGPGGEIVPIEDVCGRIYPIPSIRQIGFSQAIAETYKPSIPHYHKVGFETYYIISGEGKVMVGDVISHVGPDSFIQIEPMTAHCIFPETRMLIFVTNSPPWLPEDQFILDEDNPDVKFFAEMERMALGDLLLYVADLNVTAITMANLKAMSKKELREAIGTHINQ